MKTPASPAAIEPVGIVITLNTRVEQPTVFSAYIWGPAPAPPQTRRPGKPE